MHEGTSTSSNALQSLLENGLLSKSLFELLAIGTARRAEDVEANRLPSERLMRELGGAERLRNLDFETLNSRFGLERFEVVRFLAAFELGWKAEHAGRQGQLDFSQPENVYEYLKSDLQKETQEYFITLNLDAKNRLLRKVLVSKGALSSTQVGPREVFREAVRDAACSVIVAHNHPSGDPEPSRSDIEITSKLKAIGITLDIPVLDHIIVGDGSFVSFKRRNMI